MLPEAINREITTWLKENAEENCNIINVIPLSGGSINQSYRIRTACRDFFLKYNYTNLYPGMFHVEMKGLELLASTKSVSVPKVCLSTETNGYSILLLEYLEQTKARKNFWEILAKQLAQLHSVKEEKYGLDYDNYIGSIKQTNTPTKNYFDFITNERFVPLIQRANQAGYFTITDMSHFERLLKNLPDLIPIESPSLIHGDLWSGNVISDNEGNPYVIDPAVYYGNRESDIAMTKLFGGFPQIFYESYNYYHPLMSSWQKRVDFYQLYPLLVHVLLFGESYAFQVRNIIRNY
ncbi:MAG TPA: fructosamine kinase family protein [Lentimicrobium sp.]|nr:fructosamine kinase family protein [Lentimicrobium sp.]